MYDEQRILNYNQNFYILMALYIAVTLYIKVTGKLPKISVALYFLQSWPVYNSHPLYNCYLAISQGWQLHTGLTV